MSEKMKISNDINTATASGQIALRMSHFLLTDFETVGTLGGFSAGKYSETVGTLGGFSAGKYSEIVGTLGGFSGGKYSTAYIEIKVLIIYNDRAATNERDNVFQFVSYVLFN